MAQLINPFDARDFDPWSGQPSWHHVANPYSYVIEPGELIPVFPEPPVGLFGEIMRFIEAKAPHPMRYAAVAGALGLLAAIVGRAWNVEGSGLNVFVVLLSPSGSGKEMASKGPGILMNPVVQKTPPASGFIGPSDASSKPAIHRYISKARPPSFVMFINEFGEFIEPIVSPTASEAKQSTRKILLDLFEKSGWGSVLGKSAYADTEKNIETVERPAVSIVGDSTAAIFYGAMNEKNTAGGLFPRFVILENQERTGSFNERHASIEPSAELIERISDLCSQSLNLNNQNTIQNIEVSKDASFDLVDFRNRCAEERDAAKEEHVRAIWSRGYIQALRIAGILAVGRNLYKPTIEPCDATWAVSLVTCSIEKLLNRFEDGEIGDVSQSEVARQTKIRRVVEDWFTKPWSSIQNYVPVPEEMRKFGYIPYKYLSKRLTSDAAFKTARNGATNAIKNSIAEMIRNGELVRATPGETKTYTNSLAEFYRIAGGATLINSQMTKP